MPSAPYDDQRQSTRVICTGGLDSTENHLMLSTAKPGAATTLVNYEVGLTGGYRRISGFAEYDATYSEIGVGVAEGRVLGIMFYEHVNTGVLDIIAARKDTSGATYSFYLYTVGAGWVAIATGLTHVYDASITKLRWDVANDGADNYLCVVDGYNNALLYDGTTWAFIDSADTGADLAHAGGAQAINAPSFVSFFSAMLFLAGDYRNSSAGVIAYSAPNAFFNFTSASGGGQATAGLAVVQIKPFRSNLYVFGKNGIKKGVADASAGFLISDVTSNIGCLASDSVLEIGGDLVFLAPDGVRPVSGTDKIGDVELESISKPSQFMITQKASTNDLTTLNGVVIRGKSQFRYFIGSDDIYAVADAPGIIGALRDTSMSYTAQGYIPNGWEFGELRGIRCSCVASRYTDDGELVLHGDYDGKIYQQESGNTFNGSNIISTYATPYLDLGDTEVRKVFEKITLFLRAEGAAVISVGVEYDWGLANAVNPPNSYVIDLGITAPEYDDGTTYDSGAVYGGQLVSKVLTDIQGSFFSARLTFSTHSNSASFSVHALVLEYGVKGRR